MVFSCGGGSTWSGSGGWCLADASGWETTRAVVLPSDPLKETSAFVRAERQALVSCSMLDQANESRW